MLELEYDRMAKMIGYKRLNESEDREESVDSIITNVIDSEEEKLVGSSYLGIDERKVLPFPMKYATIGSDISLQSFLNDMEYLYLKLKKEGKNIDQITSILTPHLEGINEFGQFMLLLEEYDGIKYIPKEEVEKYGHRAKERFLEFPKGDEKNVISYRFNANPNRLKLTPTGYWQLQFLARTANGEYKYSEDEVFIISRNKEIFRGNALTILQNFYTAVFKKMIPAITGRFHLETQFRDFDVDQQIMLEDAVSHFIDQLVAGKYNTESNNIGAWAMQVMKNKVKETIRNKTDMSYRTGFDTKAGNSSIEAFRGNNITSVKSFLSPSNVDPELESHISGHKFVNDTKPYYIYTFNTPDDAFYVFNAASDVRKDNPKLSNPFLLKYLSSEEQTRLRQMGVLLSTRRDVGFSSDESEEPAKLGNSQGDEQFIKLYQLFSKFGLSMGDNKIRNQNNDPEGEYDQLRWLLVKSGIIQDVSGDGKYRILDKGEYERLMERDFGKAIYHTISNMAWEYPIWISKPSSMLMSQLEQKYPDRDFKETKTNTPVGKSFLDKDGNPLPEVDDLIRYETGMKSGGREALVQDFIDQQKEKISRGEIAFFPARDTFAKISQIVDAIRGPEGKGGFLQGQNRTDFNNIMTSLSGVEIMRESVYLRSARLQIRRILKENSNYLI